MTVLPRKGGAVYRNGRFVPQALANLDRAIELLQKRAATLGEPAAVQAVKQHRMLTPDRRPILTP